MLLDNADLKARGEILWSSGKSCPLCTDEDDTNTLSVLPPCDLLSSRTAWLCFKREREKKKNYHVTAVIHSQ